MKMLMTSITDEDRKDLADQINATMRMANKQIAKHVPKTQAGRDAFEQWTGAVDLYEQYAKLPDNDQFRQAREYLEATFENLKTAIANE